MQNQAERQEGAQLENSTEVLQRFSEVFDNRINGAIDQFVGSKGTPHAEDATRQLLAVISEEFPKVFEEQKAFMGESHSDGSRSLPWYGYMQSLQRYLRDGQLDDTTYGLASRFQGVMQGVRDSVSFLKSRE